MAREFEYIVNRHAGPGGRGTVHLRYPGNQLPLCGRKGRWDLHSEQSPVRLEIAGLVQCANCWRAMARHALSERHNLTDF